jgi:hypothetical protein
MFGFFSGIEAKFVGAIIILLMLVGAWFYVKSLQSSLDAAQSKIAVFEDIISSQKLAMDTLKNDISRMNNIQSEYSEQIGTIDEKVRGLADRFTKDKNGKPRDFSHVVHSHPEVMEKAINRGSRDALRCNELVTGAKLTPEERSGKVRNSICPELLGGRR